MNETEGLQLVFNGPRDSSPETLRKIKGVFIAELDCSIDEVKQFLEEAPTVVFSTDKEEELRKVLKILESAGGIVSIAGENGEEQNEAPQEEPSQNGSAQEIALSTETTEELSNTQINSEIDREEADDSGVEFTFDLEELTEEKKKAPAPKVYTLEFDPDESTPNPLSNPPKEETNVPETEATLTFDEAEEKPALHEPEALEQDAPEPKGTEINSPASALSFEEDSEPGLTEPPETALEPEMQFSIPEESEGLEESTPPEAPAFQFEEGDETVGHSVMESNTSISTPSEDEVGELDLTLSFSDSDEPEMELHEASVVDQNVAGEGINWDLSFDEGESEEEESLLEDDHEENAPPVEKQEDQAGQSLAFDLEEEESQSLSSEVEYSEKNELEEEQTAQSETPSETGDENLLFDLDETVDAVDDTPSLGELDTLAESDEVITSAESLPSLQADVEIVHENPLDSKDSEPEVKEASEEIEEENEGKEIARSVSPAKGSSGSSSPSPQLIIGSIAVVLLILNGFLFWSNFFSKQARVGITEDSLDSMIKATAQQVKADLARRESEEKSAPKIELLKLSGSITGEYGTIWFAYIAQGDKILAGEMTFSAVKPPEQSKRDFGLGKLPAPWIHNADITNLRFKFDDSGQGSAATQIRLFVEQGKERFRELGDAKVFVGYDGATDLVVGELLLSSQKDQTVSEEPGYSFTGSQDSGFSLDARIPFSSKGNAKPLDENEK